MKTFLAAFLGVLVAAVVLAVILTPPPAWRRTADAIAQRFRSDRADAAAERATQQRREGQLQAAAAAELQEQRRERLTLLTAALGGKPLAPLTGAETRLFQDAARRGARAIAGSDQRQFVRLLEPVQIDEWTTLLPGTPVELLGYMRDNIVRIGHHGARFDVGSWQAGLPTLEPLPEGWSALPTADERRVEYLTELGSR